MGGSYNRVITFKHANPDDAKVLVIRVWNEDDGMQTVNLEFNNNTTMRQFFMSCPIEWRNLVRNPKLEIYPEHQPQIDFDKDVSILKHAHFHIQISDNHYSYKGGCSFNDYKIFYKYDFQARQFAQRQAALQPKTSSMTLF